MSEYYHPRGVEAEIYYRPVNGVLSKLAITAAQNRMHGVKMSA